jgi:aryl-alcohol dehydrogenase-like predicted oxidoreductase
MGAGALGASLAGACASSGQSATPQDASAPPASGGPVAAQILLPSSLPQRRLGRTDVTLPVLGLGGHHLGLAPDEAAARALVDAALEEGIRFFDTAESYQDGRSERWLGAALRERGVRSQVFLMTKTFAPQERSAESARRHLEGSLQRLQIDSLDLWQLHSIQSPEDVDRAFAEGGAMEFILEQKAAGVVRFTGVTGHVNPAAHRRAVEWWDRGLRFDVMQMPVNPIDAHQLSFQREVLPLLVERDIGVLAMKTSASGALLQRGLCSVEECLRYVLGLPVSLAIVGMETPAHVVQNAGIARASAPLDEPARAALLARLQPRKDLSLEWYKKA